MNAAPRVLCCLGLWTVLGVVASTPLSAEPTIVALSLRGLQSGAATSLTISGTELGPETRLLLPVPIAEQRLEGAAAANSVTLVVTLAADVPAGIYPLRVATPTGVSAAIPIAIDALPQLPFSDQIATLPVALHGAISGTTRLRSKFTGRKDQRIVVEVEARRLKGMLNPVARLYDSRDAQLAWSPALSSAGGDARLEATLPADGEYTVELHDALFRGAQPGHFRLKVGEFNYADMFFPPAAQRGAQVAAEAVATNLPADAKLTGQAVGNLAAPLATPSGVVFSGFRPAVLVSDNAEFTEPDSAGGPHAVPAAPVGISGRLNAPHEEDVYRLPVSPGSKLRFELFAERIGSPVDAVLSIRNEQNGQLAANDDRPNTVDPGLEFTVPAGVNALHVAVKDLSGASGRDFIYRLVVEPMDRPRVRVEAEVDRMVVPQGGVALLPIKVQRTGFNEALKLELPGLPVGVTATGTEIAPGVSKAIVTLTGGDAALSAALAKLAVNGGAAANASTEVLVGPDETIPAWLRDQLAVAIVGPPPMRLAWEQLPSDEKLSVGRALPLQVKLDRGADTVGSVRLALITSQIVPQRTVKKDNKDVQEDDPLRTLRLAESPTLPAEATFASLVLLAPPDLPKTPYDIAVRADHLSADGKTVLASVVTPALRLLAVEPPAEAPVALFEDEADFVAALDQGVGAAELASDVKYSGAASLKVTGQQKFNPALPGMSWKIREFPAAGEYRFVRFAWKKQGGEAIAIQLAHDGKFGPESDGQPTFRYHSGKPEVVFGGSLRVSDKTPDDWVVVTRDLFADFGEFTLTGLSLAPIDGDAAYFDHLYLGRGPGDFPAAP